jgi:amino-acid N-acetyltransferase
VDIRPARAGDFEVAKKLLQTAGLPVEDLSAAHVGDFLVASIDGVLVGFIGLEPFRDIGLLRSLVVDPGARDEGLGRLLVTELEAQARQRGITELWLLTIDADGYFSKLGYRAQERHTAPENIRQTDEFSTLCPGDAVLMKKTI